LHVKVTWNLSWINSVVQNKLYEYNVQGTKYKVQRSLLKQETRAKMNAAPD
jgi:hypothetical protein